MNKALSQKITLPSLLKFTLPSMVMMVVMSLYSIVDGLFVARLIGTEAFSAVNLVFPLLGVAIALGTMFGTGLNAIVSRKLGEGRQREANENLTFVLLVVIIIGVAATVLCAVFLKDIIYMLGADEAVYGYCYDYAFPLMLFAAPCILQLVFQNLYIANGKPSIGLAMTIAGGVCNVVFDYLFIAVFQMGIAGAAIATGIGNAIPALFGLFYFALNRRGNLHFVRPKQAWSVFLHTMGNGSSEMVSNLSTSVTTFLFNIIMMRLVGHDGVAAISVLLYLDFILIAVCLGYSMGVAPLISYNYGCGNKEKLRKIFRLSMGLLTAVGVSVAALTFLFSRDLTSFFAPRDSQVFLLASAGLQIYALSYLFKGYNVFASAMFTAFSNGPVSALLSCMRTLVLLAAALIGLSILLGITGVWLACPVAEFLSLALTVFFFMKYRRRYHYI